MTCAHTYTNITAARPSTCLWIIFWRRTCVLCTGFFSLSPPPIFTFLAFTFRAILGLSSIKCEGEQLRYQTCLYFADIDECASRPCLNGGTCIDGVNSYQCRCQSPYYGNRCENQSQSIKKKIHVLSAQIKILKIFFSFNGRLGRSRRNKKRRQKTGLPCEVYSLSGLCPTFIYNK